MLDSNRGRATVQTKGYSLLHFFYFRYLQEQGKGCPAYRPVEMPVEVRLFFRKVRKV